MPERLAAPAKINLFLRIDARRADGYHDLESLFVPVAGLCDTLEISPAAAGSGCTVTPELPDTPAEKNLVFRAWEAYAQATGFAPDLAVRLDKRIPTGMGLGGGSSDAAAMLRWLNDLAGRAGRAALAPEALNALAAGLGADVPFFLLGVPAVARGIGDRLTPVELDLSAFTLVLALPPVHVSTAWAYGRWDALAALQKPSREGLTTGRLTHKRRVSLSPVRVWNDFEAAVFPAFADLRRLKERLLALGAACAVMSGSGAGIAALFRNDRLALDAADALRTKVPVHVETLRHWGVAKR